MTAQTMATSARGGVCAFNGKGLRAVSARIAPYAGRMVCKTVATRFRRTTARSLLALAAFGAWSNPGRGHAEPLRLRADAIAETQAPAGLVVLQGQDKLHPWIDAEGLVWA